MKIYFSFLSVPFSLPRALYPSVTQESKIPPSLSSLTFQTCSPGLLQNEKKAKEDLGVSDQAGSCGHHVYSNVRAHYVIHVYRSGTEICTPSPFLLRIFLTLIFWAWHYPCMGIKKKKKTCYWVMLSGYQIEGDLAYQVTLGHFGRHFWVSWLVGVYNWHLVGRGQGCCQTIPQGSTLVYKTAPFLCNEESFGAEGSVSRLRNPALNSLYLGFLICRLKSAKSFCLRVRSPWFSSQLLCVASSMSPPLTDTRLII